MNKQQLFLIGTGAIIGILVMILFLIQPRATQTPIPLSTTPTPVTVPLTKTPQQETPSATTPSPTPLSPYESALQKQDIIALMPVTNTVYTIEYFYTSDSFIVTITQSPYAENRKKAEEWFANMGIDTTKLNVLWTSRPYIQ